MSPIPTPRDLAWTAWRHLPPSGKLAFAHHGLRVALADLRSRGVHGHFLATVLIPVGLAYIIAAVARDSTRYRAGAPVGRQLTDRKAYLRHRYGGTQRLVDWRERRLVGSLLARVGRPARVLDVPSGYGRFVPQLGALATEQLVCADIDRPRLVALTGAERGSSVVQADLQGALPFRTAGFDVVFNLRYLHHAKTASERERALAELARVSRRYVVVSYYRRSNLHAVVRWLQKLTRRNRRGEPAMIAAAEFQRLVHGVGYRAVRDRALLPGFHAQRVVLLEKPASSKLTSLGPYGTEPFDPYRPPAAPSDMTPTDSARARAASGAQPSATTPATTSEAANTSNALP
jgi:SAM-dependent methyltransferase